MADLNGFFIVSGRWVGDAITFKLRRRLVAQTRMHARGVVPTLDIGKHAMLRRRAGRKVLTMGLLDLQRMPETLHRRVVVAIAMSEY